jgi:hypothetical protein
MKAVGAFVLLCSAISAQAAVHGYVDAAGDSSWAPYVAKGEPLYVGGWAADTVGGAPVQSVTILVDGVSVGTASLGGVRPDVAAAFGRSDFTNSGWGFQMLTGSLSIGPHTISANATGASGTPQAFPYPVRPDGTSAADHRPRAI